MALEPGDVITYRAYNDIIGVQEEVVDIDTPLDDMPDPRMVMYVDKKSAIQHRKATASEKLATLLSKLVYEDELRVDHTDLVNSQKESAPSAGNASGAGEASSLEAYEQPEN